MKENEKVDSSENESSQSSQNEKCECKNDEKNEENCKCRKEDKCDKSKHDGHELKHKLHELEDENKTLQEELSSLKSELAEASKTASSYLNTASYYKSQADANKKDLERFKERNKDIESQAKTKAEEDVAKKILPILDSFDQAMLQLDGEIMKGFAMIYSSLENILKDLGVTQIDCLNQKLNPELHNCINTEKTDDEALDDVISKVYQKGYKFKETDKVIRPATVCVFKHENV